MLVYLYRCVRQGQLLRWDADTSWKTQPSVEYFWSIFQGSVIKCHHVLDYSIKWITLLTRPLTFRLSWHDEIFSFDVNLINIYEHYLHVICIFVLCLFSWIKLRHSSLQWYLTYLDSWCHSYNWLIHVEGDVTTNWACSEQYVTSLKTRHNRKLR